jgi:hypothetical protein
MGNDVIVRIYYRFALKFSNLIFQYQSSVYADHDDDDDDHHHRNVAFYRPIKDARFEDYFYRVE